MAYLKHLTCYIIVTLCFHIYRESDSRNGVIQVLPLVSNLLKVTPLIQDPPCGVYILVGRR